MTAAIQCANHPRHGSDFLCLESERRLCSLCLVQTTRHERCKPCASAASTSDRQGNLAFPVAPILGGLAASIAAWLIIPYLGFFPFSGIRLQLALGLVVVQTMDLLAEKSGGLIMTVLAIADVVLGCLLVNLVLLAWSSQQIHADAAMFGVSFLPSVLWYSVIQSAVAALSAAAWMYRIRV